ncbi:putative 26S proteasome non-ATPase regulatory subunit 11 [Blattamonas nauphoetae]|uniref:26S proteasome non-ATPase regulatory subunit 11 n=1 Tax=Blattamonas nauphoetae TaxID=2049346 RepID=A0ABQ9YLC4_9EUKA|nr:putative 26S proteasome non-ATPase regulatory subunit 11 [Blattamonas nauphoetae]
MEKDLNEVHIEGETEMDIETSILQQARQFEAQQDSNLLIELLEESKKYFDSMANTRIAKIVRTIIDILVQLPNPTKQREEVVQKWIDWSTKENKTFLRFKLELAGASLNYELGDYTKMKGVLAKLLKEVKRLDDKRLLVEIHILECQCFLRLMDLHHARASLTSARMEANSVYIPQQAQARLDLWSGLVCMLERDFSTAYSYFYESWETFAALNSPKSLFSLKMVCIARLMQSQSEEVLALLSGKLLLKYAGQTIHAIRDLAKSLQNQSLHDFQTALSTYPEELTLDPFVEPHLEELRSNLFEKHLSRIILPYSVVEISHVAFLIGIDEEIVERKLAQMILDGKLSARLDQETRCVTIIDSEQEHAVFSSSMNIYGSVRKVLDSLTSKARLVK